MRKVVFGMGFLMIAVAGCCLFDAPSVPTTVKGTVYNPVTGEKIQGLNIQVQNCWGFISVCDSLTSVSTNDSGEFKIVFDAWRGYYELLPDFDDSHYIENWAEHDRRLKIGEENNIDFRVIPYSVLMADISVNKGSKGTIYLEVRGDTYSFNQSILFDTDRTHQLIDTILFTRIVPNGNYRIVRSDCNLKPNPGGWPPELLVDCDRSEIPVTIPYQDTVRITIR